MPVPTPAVAAYEADHSHQGFRIAELRTLFARIVDPADWRGPWKATIPARDLPALKTAADYFHASAVIVLADRGGTIDVAGEGLRKW